MAEEIEAARLGEEDETPLQGKPPSAANSFLSGGFGGLCLVIVGHPLDLIKVKIQTGGDQYKGIMDVARKTIKAEGPRGFYRGVSAPLLGITPIFAVSFWGYDTSLNLIRSLTGRPEHSHMTITDKFVAGGLSGFPATVLTAPIERMKCLLQIQGQEVAAGRLKEPKYTTLSGCGRELMRTGGLSSVYKGWEATLLRDVPGSATYFGTYEVSKAAFTRQDGTISTAGILTAGGLAGMMNWVVAIPADTVKSRWQTAPEGTYKGTVDVARYLLKEEGWTGFFKGIRPALVRAFPANAACFMGVTVSKDLLLQAGV